MKMRSLFAAALALLLPLTAAAVETGNPFRASGNMHVINVSNVASTAEQLSAFSSDATCTQYLLTNTGTVDAWVVLAQTAALAGAVTIPSAGSPAAAILVRAGTTKTVAGPSQAYITTKTAASTTTLNATCGQGNTEAHTNVVTSSAGTGASANQTQGNGADGAAAVGNAVRIAGTDGSGNTQDVLTGTDGRLAENLSQVAGTTVDTNSGSKSAGTIRVVLATDQPALTNKLLVTPDANSAVNVAQVAGTAASVNNGTTDAGTQRVTLSSDSTGQVKLATGANTIGALTANQSVNTAQINGTTVNVNTGAVGAGSQRVAVGTDANTIAGSAPGTAGAASTNVVTTQNIASGVGADSSGRGIVVGAAAIGAAQAGAPVLIGGRDSSGNVQSLGMDSAGTLATAGSFGSSDTGATVTGGLYRGNGTFLPLATYPYAYNGTNFSRQRTAEIGNSVAATGLLAATPYGEYLTNANQFALATGQYGALQFDPAGNLRIAPQRPATGDILTNSATVTATTGTTALSTVPAGRTAVGDVCVSVSGSKAAAATGNGEVLGTVLSAGTSVTPAAGTYFEVDTAMGANAATGTTGTNGSDSNCTKWTQTSPAGNSTTINYVTTCTSTTACRISVSFNGTLQ